MLMVSMNIRKFDEYWEQQLIPILVIYAASVLAANAVLRSIFGAVSTTRGLQSSRAIEDIR